MCQRLIDYHKEKSEMSGTEVLAGLGIVGAILGLFELRLRWVKGYTDQVKEDHDATAKCLARDYMDKENTMQMYSLMNQTTEVRMTGVESAVTELKNSNSEHFNKIYEKLDKLADK